MSYSNQIEVMFISAHINHPLDATELPFLPLSQSTRDEVALKVSKGISTERILKGNTLIFVHLNIERDHLICRFSRKYRASSKSA